MRKLPSLRRHKPTAQAVVTLSGKDHYLGVWPADRRTPPPDIQARYDRLVTEWLAGGREPLSATDSSARALKPNLASPAPPTEGGPTVAEVLAGFWKYAVGYYRKPDGS